MANYKPEFIVGSLMLNVVSTVKVSDTTMLNSSKNAEDKRMKNAKCKMQKSNLILFQNFESSCYCFAVFVNNS